MMLDPKVFKAYDIRGKVPDDFDAEGAGRIAQAYLLLLQQEGIGERPVVVLGRDARPSSEPVADAVRKSLAGAGVRVLDIGLSTTPLFYFAVNRLDAGGGIMVTASHNPPPDNGLKLVRAEAVAIGEGAGMEEVRDFALSDASAQRGKGSIEEVDVLEEYVAFLLQHIRIERPLNVVIDTGNGMASLVLERLLPKLPQLTVQKTYFDIDFTFPNHEANPLKEETLEDLKAAVRKGGFDLGIAFDADGDRVGFVTHAGETVRGDFITALLAQEVLTHEKGATVVFEVKSSRIVPDVVEAGGGTPLRIRTGHAAANATMRQHDAPFAGELSGHYYFRETFYRDGAIFAMLRVLSLVSHGKTLAQLVEPFKRYVQSGEMNFEVADKEGVLARAEEAFSDGRITKIDGLTVEYEDWWFNVRASNTEDLIRLNVEANTQELLDEKLLELKKLIEV